MKDKERTFLTQCFIIARTHSSHLSSSHLFTSFPVSPPICSAQLLHCCVPMYVRIQRIPCPPPMAAAREEGDTSPLAQGLSRLVTTQSKSGRLTAPPKHHIIVQLLRLATTHASFVALWGPPGTCPRGIAPCTALWALLLNASHHHLELPHRQVLHLIDSQRSPTSP